MVKGSVFCGKCGTYTRPFPGRRNRICPKCHPDKIITKKSPLDKTGMPCKDRGVCRPERCVKALECEERMRG